MANISDSVGLNGANQPQDVRTVQELLNQNRHRVPDGREIPEDGIVGPKTIFAIKRFQTSVLGMRNPDGRVDPSGKTLHALNSNSSPRQLAAPTTTSAVIGGLRFPLGRRPQLSYKTGGRFFGAQRSGGRLHAGCDLIASAGTEILAVADGQVLAYYPFYSGTNALEVHHSAGFVVRYGEISRLASGLRVGSDVRRGQVIAAVGRLNSGSSMLHFEMYSGSLSGALTVRSNPPYQRRSDLNDPTGSLDNAALD